MIRVKMTPNLAARPPKVIGPFTLKRLIWTAIGLAVGIPVALIIPGDIVVRIVLGAILTAPFVVIGWFPESETSPATIIKAMVKTNVLVYGIRTHNGNSAYYKKAEKKYKITRHAERRAWK